MSDDLRETVGGAIAEAIGAGLTPGAVVLIARGDEILCHEAVGDRSLVPERLPVEPDTVFDVASLTKVVATTTVVMQLAEGGALSLDDELRRWLPEFTGEARDRVTIRDLLAHCSGLPAHRRLGDSLGEDVAEDDRRERATAAICRLPLEHAPGEGVIYSCLGFILLTTVVQVASGRRLEDLACERVFGPLGMADTGFCPPPAARARCAATEQLPDGTLIGVVHDENARYLGGVGGNAGLFSTAADLARFGRALLHGGALDGVRILSEATVREMFSEQAVSGEVRRCLGWRLANSGDPLTHGAPTVESIGHTGFTGTSLWIDRDSGLLVILLTNRVHMGREIEIEPLRRRTGAIAAGQIGKEHA
ncbi:MAG: serine hydrolase domain-containing protein [Armatimonadota bacterium]|jgi:CubicO group peptidase (beta-lactamase class C family)